MNKEIEAIKSRVKEIFNKPRDAEEDFRLACERFFSVYINKIKSGQLSRDLRISIAFKEVPNTFIIEYKVNKK